MPRLLPGVRRLTMARIRSIKPEFFTSLNVAAVSPAARLCFVGLWTHADDEGRFLDECRLVKAALFPLDDDITATVVAGYLDELVAAGHLARYGADGIALMQVTGWHHQKIDRRAPSKWPSRPLDESSTNPRRVLDEDSSPDLWIYGSKEQEQEPCAHTSRDTSTTVAALSAAPPPADVDQAARTIATRRTIDLEASAKRNPARWLAAAIRGIAAEEVAPLAATHPDWTAEQLADAIEPPPAEPEPTRPPIDHTHCPDCSGDGWNHHDDGVTRCPNEREPSWT